MQEQERPPLFCRKQGRHSLRIEIFQRKDEVFLLVGNDLIYVVSVDTDERYRGYMDVLEEYPDMEIIAVQTAAWQKDEAYLIVQNWIRNKEFDAVLSENDNMALGAVEAVYEANKEDDIRVYGVDGDMYMLYSVRNGRANGTVYHDAIRQADILYEYILDIMNGIQPPEKEYRIPFTEVTIDNVDQYIEVMEKYG